MVFLLPLFSWGRRQLPKRGWHGGRTRLWFCAFPGVAVVRVLSRSRSSSKLHILFDACGKGVGGRWGMGSVRPPRPRVVQPALGRVNKLQRHRSLPTVSHCVGKKETRGQAWLCSHRTGAGLQSSEALNSAVTLAGREPHSGAGTVHRGAPGAARWLRPRLHSVPCAPCLLV